MITTHFENSMEHKHMLTVKTHIQTVINPFSDLDPDCSSPVLSKLEFAQNPSHDTVVIYALSPLASEL